MKMKLRYLLLIALTLAAGATLAHAHALWVGSNRYLLKYPGTRPGPITVALFTGYGHRMPIDETYPAERFGGFSLIAPDGKAMPVKSAEDGYHGATVKIDRAGAWMAVTASNPAFSTRVKDSSGVITYVSRPRNELPPGTDVVESNIIRTFGKTVIHVSGDGAADAIVTKPAGHELELVPAKNPGGAAVGDTVPMQVWFKGKPYAGETIEVTAEHVASPVLGDKGKWRGETDAQGRVSIPVGLAGLWMVTVTIFEPTTGDMKMKADQTRFRATLVFEVPGLDYSS